MKSLTSYEPIGRIILTSDNYYEWSEDIRTHLEGKNLLMCIQFESYTEYAQSRKKNEEKFQMKEEYEREVRSAKRRCAHIEIKAPEGETERETILRKDKNEMAMRAAQENLEDELVKINREWRSMRLRWIEEEERSLKNWEEANQKC
jgi:hypothetical protein